MRAGTCRFAALVTLSALVPSLALPVTIKGRRLLVNGKPFFLKGVNWNPVPKGGQQGHGGVHFRGFVETDSELMAAAGINAVRTYEPITDKEVLDVLWKKGIVVLNTLYISGDTDPENVVKPVITLKDHPAILMWVIGNEWNYNMLYSGMSFAKALARVRKVAHMIKVLDTTHPVTTVYGMVPPPEHLSALEEVDVWGLTAYTGLTFGNLFDLWVERSEKPMFVAEFGADAFNSKTGALDEADQAKATVALTQEVIRHGKEDAACIGGLIFELADEWWKDVQGTPSTHNTGGVAPGGGPFPDNTFNEEYWGLVAIDGTPRQAFRAYASIGIPDAFANLGHSAKKIALSDITAGYRMKACGANRGCLGRLGDCCPGKDNKFHDCCSAASKQVKQREPPAGKAEATTVGRTVDASGSSQAKHPVVLAPLAPWTPHAHSRTAGAPPSHCEVEHAVPCCPDGDCGSCAGNQCCPSKKGSVTCPSASKALAEGCIHPKLYDCTGRTGTVPPRTTTTTPRDTTTTPARTESMTRHPSSPSSSIRRDSHSTTTISTTTGRTTRMTSRHTTGRPTTRHATTEHTTTRRVTLERTTGGRMTTRHIQQFHAITPTTAPATTSTQPRSTTTLHPTTIADTSGASTTPTARQVQRFDIHPRAAGIMQNSLDDAQAQARTTTEIAISVHTTMQVLFKREPAGAWVLGDEKASCDEVCKRAGGCVEGMWPTNQREFMRIVNDLGYACFDLEDGGGKYDPSTQQGNCGWNWSGGRELLSSEGPAMSRCATRAPAFTRRFCPCQSRPDPEHERTSSHRPAGMFSSGRRMLKEGDGHTDAPDNLFA